MHVVTGVVETLLRNKPEYQRRQRVRKCQIARGMVQIGNIGL